MFYKKSFSSKWIALSLSSIAIGCVNPDSSSSEVLIGAGAAPDSEVEAVTVRLKATNGPSCSGTVICSNNHSLAQQKKVWVATAAHCVKLDKINRVYPGYPNTLAGAEVFMGTSVAEATRKCTVIKDYVHPNWDSRGTSSTNDIALLFVDCKGQVVPSCANIAETAPQLARIFHCRWAI